MARKIVRELTYFEPRKCYKKKVAGQVFYVGRGSDRDTNENYNRAWEEFKIKRDELAQVDRGEKLANGGVLKLMSMLESPALLDPAKLEEAGMQVPKDLAEIMQRQNQTGGNLNNNDLLSLLKMLDLKGAEKSVTRTVGDMVKTFLDGKRKQAKTEQKSVGRFANIESYVRHFETFVGADKPISAIDGVALQNYFTMQLDQIGEEEITCWAGRDRLQVAKQFIRHCWELDVIELPRNIESRNLTISCTPGDINPMPVAELQKRVKKATGRLRLELLLMANCGFYQVDCADLQHSEINFKTSTITRKRSKTKKEANAPTVTWNLWESTVALLRQEATTEGGNVLATRNGLATVHDAINSDGKASRTDATAQAYKRLQDGLKGDRWPLKSIRKAAASAIGSNPDFARYVQYFLGQAPDSVATAHYVKPSAEQFAKCINWLGQELELTTVDQIEKNK
jgi:integrase